MQDHPCIWSSPARTALPQVNQSVISCCPSGIPRAWTSVREYPPGVGVSLPSQPGTSKCHLLGLSFQARPRLDDGKSRDKWAYLLQLLSPHLPSPMSLSIQVLSPIFFSSRRTHGGANGLVSCFLSGLEFASSGTFFAFQFSTLCPRSLARPHTAPQEQGYTTGWCWSREATL